jgi:glycine/D-amino acid oxidase-like deaminating enzyme
LEDCVQHGVAVVGAGPLGAATARELVHRGVPNVVLLDGESPDDHSAPRAAYRSSGGSICWYRSDPAKAELIRTTAEHVQRRVADGARIDVRELPYLLLEHGVQVPALNVNSSELVTDLVGEATRGGALLQRTGVVDAVTPTQTGWEVRSGPDSGAGTVTATVVVLALGAGNVSLLPGLQPRLEKRQLFVLDLPVDEDRARIPHVVARVGHGYAYVFVKNLPEGQRVVLGHEDLVPDDDPTGPVDYLAQLLEAGVADAFPFLGAARADRILWGMDWADKFPRVCVGEQPTLLAINCGSGVRACIGAGRAAADAVERALSAA